ncbi:hypothetical protein L596_026480 [Steinernema carpocapsae]|uniref:Uncharacterized protein n=1 Tax=Steinernema carpocapsae TaxID=34508 RepID=A0A4U5M1I5_STECR|nr:hypothetical protein L596_026480 [Steinernema carpocapsae]
MKEPGADQYSFFDRICGDDEADVLHHVLAIFHLQECFSRDFEDLPVCGDALISGLRQFDSFEFHSIPICLGEDGNTGCSVNKAAIGRSVDADFKCWQEIDRLGSPLRSVSTVSATSPVASRFSTQRVYRLLAVGIGDRVDQA